MRVSGGLFLLPLAAEERASAAARAAKAGMRAFHRRRMPLFEHEIVVVRKLRARGHASQRLYEDPAFLFDRLAVRRARMVDVARGVAPARGVYHDLLIHGEEHR